MKNKSLIVLLLMAFAFCFVISIQAQPPNDDDTSVLVVQSEIENPIAQNVQNYQSQTVPIPMPSFQLPETNNIDKYGLVGFTLITVLGLVVYIVKEDRKTMSEDREIMRGLVSSIQKNTQATEHHAEATDKLASQIENSLGKMHLDIKERLVNIENGIDKLNTSKG